MSNKKEIFDFGFTTTDIDMSEKDAELEEYKGRAEAYKMSMNSIYREIQPLLDNLAANPERDYIHWPNRAEKVQEFRQRLSDLLEH